MNAMDFFNRWQFWSGVTMLNGEWVRRVSIDDTSGVIMVRIHDKEALRLFDQTDSVEAEFL
jgi:hypothetical protein